MNLNRNTTRNTTGTVPDEHVGQEQDEEANECYLVIPQPQDAGEDEEEEVEEVEEEDTDEIIFKDDIYKHFTPSNITIKMDPVSDLLLDHFKKICEALQRKLASRVSTDTSTRYDNEEIVLDLLEIGFPRSLIEILLSHMNQHLSQSEQVHATELGDFLGVLYSCACHNESIKAHYTFVAKGEYTIRHGIKKARVMKLLRTLEQGSVQTTRTHYSHEPSKLVRNLINNIGETFSSLVFEKRISIISWDDWKLFMRSKNVSSHGYYSTTINRRKCIVLNGAVCLLTGIFLAGHALENGQSKIVSFEECMSYLSGTRSSSAINLENTIIAIDRGHLKKGFKLRCLDMNVQFVGTVPRDLSSAFTFDTSGEERRVGSHQKKIPTCGTRSSYHADIKTRTLNQTPALIHSIAYRKGGYHKSIGIVESTLPECRGNIYVLKRLATRKCDLANKLDIDKTDEDTAKCTVLWSQFNERVTLLTTNQGDKCWFISRIGLVTSRISYSLLSSSDRSCILLGPRHVSREPCITINLQEFEFSIDNLNKYTMIQLKDGFLHPYKLSLCGNKLRIVERIMSHVEENGKEPPIDTDTVNSNTLLQSYFINPIPDSSGMQLGKDNETNVLLELPKFCQDNCPDKIVIKEIKTLGLIRSRNPGLVGFGTSVDGWLSGVFFEDTCAVAATGTSGITTDTSGVVAVHQDAAIEIKTKSGSVSLRNEHIIALDQKVSFIALDLPLGMTDNDSLEGMYMESVNQFVRLVPERAYRCQILHHCLVTGCCRCLYVVADKRSIIRIVVVKVSINAMTYYKLCLQDLEEKIRFLRNVEETIPPDLQSNRLGYAVDIESLNITRNLRSGLEQYRSENGALPPCDIVPYSIDLWNRCKGGIDNATGIVSHCQAVFQGLNVKGKFVVIIFMIILQNLFQISKLLHLNMSDLKSYNDKLDKMKQMGSFQMFTLAVAKTIPRYFERLCVSSSASEMQHDDSQDQHMELNSERIGKMRKSKLYQMFNQEPYLSLRKSTEKVHHHKVSNEKEKRCRICSATLYLGKKIEKFNEKKQKMVLVPQYNRIGSVTNFSCSVCKVFLCTKLPRKRRRIKDKDGNLVSSHRPERHQRKPCWEKWHTVNKLKERNYNNDRCVMSLRRTLSETHAGNGNEEREFGVEEKDSGSE